MAAAPSAGEQMERSKHLIPLDEQVNYPFTKNKALKDICTL